MGNRPHAQFQVRLFGRVAFWIDFKNLRIQADRDSYTFELSDKSHSFETKPR